jgi:hypothetical protein
MSTRSFVGVQIGDLIRAVYVHHDGYLEGVGQDLQAYTTQEAVEELISHGDRSSLDSGYYRDRGETDVDPYEYSSFDEFFEACDRSWGEYYYLFRDGVWYCGTTYSSSPLFYKLVPYAEAISMSS